MFYDRFLELCKEKGVRPTNACVAAGLSRGLAAKWKSTKTEKPSAEALEKMSIYFGKSIDEILGKEKKPTGTADGQLPFADRREILAGAGVRILLDADAKLTEEQLDNIVNFIEFQQRKNGR